MTTLLENSEATAIDIFFADDELRVALNDGRVISVPLAWFPRLLDATPRQRAKWELIGGGIGIHWDAVDEDISIASLLQPKNYMRLPEGTRAERKTRRLQRKH